ncbi:hypothetical protein KR059_003658 [Drosophila kikkawai]|nr:hypothetical protein KR059_003658 [Drosophila kikkawai]
MRGQLIFGLLLLGAHFGFSFSNEHGRIINGDLAVTKQFPYQVFYDVLDLTNLQNPIEWEPYCGGTLISKRTILTAAHCFRKPNIHAIKIYFGAVDISNKDEINQHRLVVKRSNVVVHQEYNKFKEYNDIALIRLPVDVAFDEYIKPAKLPQPGEVYPSEAIASGWEAIKDSGKPIYDPKLRYLRFQILSHAECKEQLRGNFLVSSRICLEPSENSSCIGDSAGPLVVRHNGDSVLLGLSSNVATKNCAEKSPANYTRVASYLDWIHENAGANNLDE